MGYDFKVTSGRVRRQEIPALVRGLLSFASQMEMTVLPVHLRLSGMIKEDDLSRILGPDSPDWDPLPVKRRGARESLNDLILTHWFPIEEEHIQGLIFHHDYEPWSLMWNLSQDAVLADYADPGRDGAIHPPQGAKSAKEWALLVDELFAGQPGELHSENFWEKRINIHCPWRRSDVASACDALNILARHCDDFAVQDDYGIWPSNDFTRWKNLAGEYSPILGARQVNPDIADEL